MKKLILIAFLLFYTLAAAQKQNALDVFEEGQKLFSKRNYYQSAELFKQAIQLNPYFKEAYAAAGNAYFEMENYQEARKYFEKAYFYEPDNISYMLKLSLIKMKTAGSPKEYLGAEYYLLKAYKKEPRNPEVLIAYGDYYFYQEKESLALEYYEKARRSKEDFLVYLKLSQIYQKWGNDEKAYDMLLRAETLNSTSYLVTFEIGQFFWNKKQYYDAKKYFDLTLKFYPEFREGLYKIIQFHIVQNDFAEAIIKINELLKLDPENPILYYNMGLCYNGLNRFEEAIQILLEGQKYDFGDELLRLKAEEIAVKNLPLGHPIRQELSIPYLSLALNAYEKNQIDHAFLFYKRGLRINPLSVPIRSKLAELFREKTWIELFLKTLETGLFIEPKNQTLKDLTVLNQKYFWETLSYEKKIKQYENSAFLPVVLVNQVISTPASRHFGAEGELKEILLEALTNTFSLNIKEITSEADFSKTGKKGQLLLRLKVNENNEKIELSAELTALSTGNIFKKYFVRRYGNNRIVEAMLYLAANLSEDIIPFGKIIKIDDDIALINIGKLQKIKVKDRFIILKNRDIIDDYFSNTPFRKQLVVGEAEVLRVDEQIAEVRLYKSHKVVFDMINVNDMVMVKKEEVDKKEEKKP